MKSLLPVRTSHRLLAVSVTAGVLAASLAACDRTQSPAAADPPVTAAGAAGQASIPVSAGEAKAIAQDAYVFLYPMVQNYLAMYEFALDPKGGQYKGPMNQIHNVARVFTPADTSIVTPNSDTPYSYLIMDLRAEPLVVTLPRIDASRYYSLQLVDLYTHNVDYLGTRRDGNGGGNFLIAGPDWKGEAPPGIKRVVRIPSQIMFSQFRTQLLSPRDLPQVKQIQAGYKVQPLSTFLGQPAPAAPPPIDYPPISREQIGPRFWQYANFLAQFVQPLPADKTQWERFARIGVAPGASWPPTNLPADVVAAVEASGVEASKALAADTLKLTTSSGLFGTPDAMAGKYRERALGALAGIYGNDDAETLYPSYMTDQSGQLLDASKHNYTITFPAGQLPPVGAFWSVTMYDGKSRLLVDNPIDRYLINSPMASSLKKNADGSITLYLQHASPGKERESNWLPAPNGQLGVVMRLYLPKPSVLDGAWKAPPVEISDVPVSSS